MRGASFVGFVVSCAVSLQPPCPLLPLRGVPEFRRSGGGGKLQDSKTPRSESNGGERLNGPLESEIGAFDLAARFPGEPEDQPLLFVVLQPVAYAVKRTGDIFDDSLAVTL